MANVSICIKSIFTFTNNHRCTRLPPDFYARYEIKVEEQAEPRRNQEMAEDLTENPYYAENLPEGTLETSDMTQNPYYEQSLPTENEVTESNLTKNLYYE